MGPRLVWRRRPADVETPVAAWLKLSRPGRGDWMLESVEGGAVRGRYTFLGLDPGRALVADPGAARVYPRWRSDRDHADSAGRPIDALRAEVAACAALAPPGLPPLPLLVGHFGFELAAEVERLDFPCPDPVGLPLMFLVRAGLLLVFDRLADELWLVAPEWPDEPAGAAEQRLTEAEALLAQPVAAAASPGGDDRAAPPGLGAIRAAVAPADYRRRVEAARAEIAAGEIFQVVLAQRFEADFPGPPFELYRALRRLNPSPFLYFLDWPGHAVVGSSPEILVRVKEGKVTLRPIAGTRPRGLGHLDDEALAAELLADPKERAEHLMLLDLGRHDVGRVASSGSVEVGEAFGIERYSHVLHIVSEVTGVLAPGHDAIDALLAGFPAGTVSGAPKVRALEIIGALETERRGIYGGGVGYFASDGSMDSCIVLRTAVVTDGVMHVTAGAGIVADSVAEAEQRECEAKAGALFAAAAAALGQPAATAAAGLPALGHRLMGGSP